MDRIVSDDNIFRRLMKVSQYMGFNQFTRLLARQLAIQMVVHKNGNQGYQ